MFTGNAITGRAASIVSPQGRALEVRPVDVLWLARAVAHEGEPRPLVAQTLVNRWAWLADFSDRYPHLADLVRAYAQPVNPRWYPEGDLHRAQVAELEAAGDHGAALEARRRAARRLEFAQHERFGPEVQRAVTRALHGPVTLPAGALEYGPAGAPGFPEIVPGGPGRNSIYGDPWGRGTGALYSFRASFPTRNEGAVLRHAGPHGAIAATLLLVFVGFGVARRFK